jgi:hypothetical protein
LEDWSLVQSSLLPHVHSARSRQGKSLWLRFFIRRSVVRLDLLALPIGWFVRAFDKVSARGEEIEK